MQSNRPPFPCKFGQNCKHLQQGTCRFYHPNQQSGQTPNMGNPNFNPRGPKGQNYPPSNYSNPNQGNFNQGQRNPRYGNQPEGYTKSYNQPTSTNANYNNNNPSTQGQGNIPMKGDQFTSKFCFSFHTNQQCKYQQKGKCIRMHQFQVKDNIRRVLMSSQIPSAQPSKLGKFVHDGQLYLILRMGNQISILTFNNQTSNFASVKSWKFPKPQLKYTYYGQRQHFIYLACENPKTTLYDITIYNMLSGDLINIEQAHSSHVTDVIHFNPNMIFTASKDGLIRVWKIQDNNATFDKQSSDYILKQYSNGKTVPILFLDISNVLGTQIISAGTSDNRVLFFIGENLSFKQCVLDQRHAQIYKIKFYAPQNQTPMAFVIAWAQDNSASSVVAIELAEFKNQQIVNNSSKQNPRNNICLIQVIEQRLFVSNLSGTVVIYSLPNLQKTGAMLHRNPVNSIIETQYITKTQIKIPQIFVLESKYLQKPGSIGIYNIKK